MYWNTKIIQITQYTNYAPYNLKNLLFIQWVNFDKFAFILRLKEKRKRKEVKFMDINDKITLL